MHRDALHLREVIAVVIVVNIEVASCMTWMQSARWVVERMQEEAVRQGHPLSIEELEGLVSPISVPELSQAEARKLNNRGVPLIRGACMFMKKHGAVTEKVRSGLALPSEWVTHYKIVFLCPDSDVVLAGVLQNAFVYNPLDRELRAWRSR